jgi:tetratricopeptide (TPR) repeat protein
LFLTGGRGFEQKARFRDVHSQNAALAVSLRRSQKRARAVLSIACRQRRDYYDATVEGRMIGRKLTALALCGLGFSLFIIPANAAISVLGSSISEACYQAAEFSNDLPTGIETCTDALKQTPMSNHDRAATLINRGILRSRYNDAKGAFDDYNSGLALDATLGEGYVDRGAVEIVMRDLDAALADINKGIALNANRLEIAYYDRAVVNEELGNVRDAYADYKKAVELQPSFQLANDQLVRFKVVRQHHDGA